MVKKSIYFKEYSICACIFADVYVCMECGLSDCGVPASSAIFLLSPSELAEIPMMTMRRRMVRRGTTGQRVIRVLRELRVLIVC